MMKYYLTFSPRATNVTLLPRWVKFGAVLVTTANAGAHQSLGKPHVDTGATPRRHTQLISPKDRTPRRTS